MKDLEKIKEKETIVNKYIQKDETKRSFTICNDNLDLCDKIERETDNLDSYDEFELEIDNSNSYMVFYF